LSTITTTIFLDHFLRFYNSSFYNNLRKWLSSLSVTFELMNSHSGMNDNNNKDRAKLTAAAIPMAGAVVTAALLLSGVSLISSYQPAIAQENMTGGGGGGATTTDNATSTTMGGAAQGGNVTAGGGNQSTSEVRLHIEEARTALQNNDTQGALMELDLALNALGAGTQGNMTNVTTTAGGATNMTTGGGGPLEDIFGGGG
jgi:hypothetical protein